MMSESERLLTVAWQHWTPGQYPVPGRWTKGHTVDPSQPNRTLCGTKIPDYRDCCERDDGLQADGWCRRCARAERDLTSREEG